MANIQQYLQAIMDAVYGEEVRGSIHDAIKKVNDDNESYIAIKEEIKGTAASIEKGIGRQGQHRRRIGRDRRNRRAGSRQSGKQRKSGGCTGV